MSLPVAIHEAKGSIPAGLPKLNPQAVVAMGASTGGPEALRKLIAGLPPNMPPILVVQHIPAGFSRVLADSLNRRTALRVREAVDGDPLLVGQVLLAPGDQHMTVAGEPGHYHVRLQAGDKINGHRPSVDVLFRSVADCVTGTKLGIILSGMGSDGALGLLLMRKKGAITFGQDTDSSAASCMPKIAHQMGALSKIVSLQHMSRELIKALTLP